MGFDKKNFEIIWAFVLFLLIFILKYPILRLPYSWDVMNYIIPAAQHIYQNGFTIFLLEYSNGHPPFYFILLGFIFKLFGDTQIVAHSLIALFSFLAVYFTYLLGKYLVNRKVGIIAAGLMFFYPTFFSYSGMSYLSVPLAALTVMSLYFFIRGNNIAYVIISSLLVLTKERAILVPVALLFYKVLKNKKIDFKKNLIFSIPIIVFALWLLSNKFHYGYFIYPITTTFFSSDLIRIILNGFIILKSLFFDYYKWILTSLIVLAGFSFKLLKNNKKMFYYSIPSFGLFILMLNMPKFSIYFDNYFPNVINYFLIIRGFSLLFALLFFILLISFKDFIKIWNQKKFYPFYVLFIFIFLSYALVIPFAPRYSLLIYPVIFLFFSFSLVKIFKKYSYIVFIILLILFALQWNGNRSEVGFVLEYNMEYVDAIKTHQMAADYLQKNFPNSTILAAYPQLLELQYPYLGYVEQPLNVVSIPPFPGLTTKNSTIYLNPYDYNKTIDLNSIDLIYSSKQEFKNRHSRELNKILNKTLIKKFELNNKVVDIYKVNKEHKYPTHVLPLD